MKKINTLNVKQLRTEECFGYLKQVLAETENLPSEETPVAQTTAVNIPGISFRLAMQSKGKAGESQSPCAFMEAFGVDVETCGISNN